MSNTTSRLAFDALIGISSRKESIVVNDENSKENCIQKKDKLTTPCSKPKARSTVFDLLISSSKKKESIIEEPKKSHAIVIPIDSNDSESEDSFDISVLCEEKKTAQFSRLHKITSSTKQSASNSNTTKISLLDDFENIPLPKFIHDSPILVNSNVRSCKAKAIQSIQRDTMRKQQQKDELKNILDNLPCTVRRRPKQSYLFDREAVCVGESESADESGSDLDDDLKDFIDDTVKPIEIDLDSESEEEIDASIEESDGEDVNEESDEENCDDTLNDESDPIPISDDENSIEIITSKNDEESIMDNNDTSKKKKYSVPPRRRYFSIVELEDEDNEDNEKENESDDELTKQMNLLTLHPSTCHSRSSKWNLNCTRVEEQVCNDVWKKIKDNQRKKLFEYKNRQIDPTFKLLRAKLAVQYYAEYNESCFNNKLPKDVPVIWRFEHKSKLGVTHFKKLGNVKKTIDHYITLNPEFLKDDLEMRRVLVHEMCHVANAIFNSKGGHGKQWFSFVKICERKHPDLAPIGKLWPSTWEYPYYCSNPNCAKEYFSHSRSTRKFCRTCKFPIVLPPSWTEPAIYSKPLNKFAEYVKNNYSKIKEAHPKSEHKELMKLLSCNYKKDKNTINLAN